MLGVLQVDPPSPLFFILFIASHYFCPRMTIPFLMAYVSQLLCSQTILAFSPGPTRASARSYRHLKISAGNGDWLSMLLGASGAEPPLELCNEPLESVNELHLNGFRVAWGKTSSCDSSTHMNERIAKAMGVSHFLMTLQNRMHLATSVQWLRFYKSLVEPNLMFAAESSFDCNASIQKETDKVQIELAKFTLGLHRHLLKALALADHGLLPVGQRRLQLTAR